MDYTKVILLLVFIIPIGLGVFLLKRFRRLAITLISIPFVFMLVVGVWLAYEANHRFIDSTDLANESIEDISIHDILNEEFKTVHGTYETLDNIVYDESLQFSTFEIGTNADKKIVYIRTDDTHMHTENNAQVGDKLQDIISLYGDNNYKSNKMGEEQSLNYVDRDEKLHLQFWYEKNKVTQIVLYEL